MKVLIALSVWITMCTQALWALESREVLVIANRNASESVGLARYYMNRRGIPEENLVLLWVTDQETCSRDDYDRRIAAPVRRAVQEHRQRGGSVRCLLTVRGIPLRVAPPGFSDEEKTRKASLEKELKSLKETLAHVDKDSPEAARIRKEMESRQESIRKLSKENQSAAVDSELTLVLEPEYPLEGWIPNPMFVGFRDRSKIGFPKTVFMVARLDGPSADIVKRLVDDAMAAEERGLSGTAYFDARWPRPQAEKMQKLDGGYGFYDASIHLAAEVVHKRGRLRVVVDDRQELFQPGQAPQAALYCGWYSLGRYVPAFSWVRGAVGYHIASSECSTLRAGSSQVWCKRMLEEGVAAVVGPVEEPYVQAFPVPHLFFHFLTDGRYSLAEAVFLSLPNVSWRMILVGDPLYRPFGTSDG
ncbi:MAG: TIGR03790 family protein [Desulfosoma sp.]